MGRIIQLKGTKSRLKLIRGIVNEKPFVLNKHIKKFIGVDNNQRMEWLSPKVDAVIRGLTDSAIEYFGFDPARPPFSNPCHS